MTASLERDVITPVERTAINTFIAANGVTMIPRGVSGFDNGARLPNQNGRDRLAKMHAHRHDRYRLYINAGLAPEEVATRMDVGVAAVKCQAKKLGLKFKARQCPSTKLTALDRAERDAVIRRMCADGFTAGRILTETGISDPALYKAFRRLGCWPHVKAKPGAKPRRHNGAV